MMVVHVYTAVNKCRFSHVSRVPSGNVTMLLCFKRVT